MKKIKNYIIAFFMVLTMIVLTSCDKNSNDFTPEHNHSYISEVVKPTCEEKGYTKHTCECGDSYIDTEVAATGHTEVIDQAVLATCDEKGKTEGKHCSVCNKKLIEQQIVEPLGHTEVTDPAVSATCDKKGKTEGKHCSVCSEIIIAQDEVAATGHIEVIAAPISATCDKQGKTEGKYCSVCGEVIVAQDEVVALGHSYDEVIYTWNNDYSKCTASVKCSNDNSHKIEETVESNIVIVSEASLDANGLVIYTANFSNSLFEQQVYEKETELEYNVYYEFTAFGLQNPGLVYSYVSDNLLLRETYIDFNEFYELTYNYFYEDNKLNKVEILSGNVIEPLSKWEIQYEYDDEGNAISKNIVDKLAYENYTSSKITFYSNGMINSKEFIGNTESNSTIYNENCRRSEEIFIGGVNTFEISYEYINEVYSNSLIACDEEIVNYEIEFQNGLISKIIDEVATYELTYTNGIVSSCYQVFDYGEGVKYEYDTTYSRNLKVLGSNATMSSIDGEMAMMEMTLIYDNNSNLIKFGQYVKDAEGNIVDAEGKNYGYNEKGYLILEEQFEGIDEAVVSKDIYEYDEDVNIIGHTNISYDSEGNIVYKSVKGAKYDENKNIIGYCVSKFNSNDILTYEEDAYYVTLEDMSGNALHTYLQIEIRYFDDNGVLYKLEVKGESYNTQDNSIEYAQKTELYEENKVMSSVIEMYDSNKVYIGRIVYNYEYGDINRVETIYENAHKIITYKSISENDNLIYEYSLNEEDMFISESYQEYNKNGECVLYEQYTYSLDKIIKNKSVYKNVSVDSVVLAEVEFHTYDETGSLSYYIINEYTENGEFVKSTRYDSQGNII